MEKVCACALGGGGGGHGGGGWGGRFAQFCRCSAALHSFIHGPPVLAIDLPELSEAT